MSDSDDSPTPSTSHQLDSVQAKTKNKGAKVLKKESREIAYNVYQYCLEECEKFEGTGFKKYFTAAKQRASKATGLAPDSVYKIQKGVRLEGKVISGLVRQPSNREIGTLEPQDLGTVRDTIIEKYVQADIPVLQSLWGHFRIKHTIIIKVLRLMGYNLVKTATKGIAVVETLPSRLKRFEYLEGIKKCRDEGRPIVYINEIFVNVVTEANKQAPGPGLKKKRGPKYKSTPYIMLHMWNPNGPAPNSFLTFEKDKVMERYEEWIRTDLILNIPDNSAIVFPSALHPNKHFKGYPDFTASNTEMRAWLSAHSISAPDNLLKPQLHALIMKNIKYIELDSGENFLTDNEYVVLEAPAYHWGLNPIDFIWPNWTVSFMHKTPLDLDNRLIERISEIKGKYWMNGREQTLKYEQKFIEHEAEIDKIIDTLGLSDESNSDDENGF